MKKIFIISVIAMYLLPFCKKDQYSVTPIYDLKKVHVADSICRNGLLERIDFLDTSYNIDSIVVKWHDDKRKKSQETFKNGKRIFESIYYHYSGTIAKYLFIDDDDPDFFYERTYDNQGILLNDRGKIFFQGYITSIDPGSLEVRKGVDIDYKIYYPAPPDCITMLYINAEDNRLVDVFKKSTFLNFLKSTSHSNNSIGTFETNIILHLKENTKDSASVYDKSLIFKVVE